MSVQGVDYSFARPNPAKLYALGFRFAARYLSGGNSSKDLTASELRNLRAAGLSVVLVWEVGGAAAAKGYAQGVTDAKRASAQASGLGISGRPIYFAVDFDAQGAALAASVAYIKGASSVLGVSRTGVYGGIKVINACLDAGVCKFGWQTYAWSYGKWDPRAQLRQTKNGQNVAGGTLDLCVAVATDYGQFPAPPAVVPKPPVVSGGGAGGTGVPTPRVVSLADLRAFRSSQSALIVSQALVAEKLIGVARSLWNPVTGNGKAFRVYRNAHGGDTVTALRILGKAHGFTVTA